MSQADNILFEYDNYALKRTIKQQDNKLVWEYELEILYENKKIVGKGYEVISAFLRLLAATIEYNPTHLKILKFHLWGKKDELLMEFANDN